MINFFAFCTVLALWHMITKLLTLQSSNFYFIYFICWLWNISSIFRILINII